ncbi:TIGR03984 family CRISPR-associated protein [Streptomyces sp. HB-N217]|uniref:type III-D CRISPR-associated protein Csx19 n=1 Tax=Streptomyces sp. HB-N217 TaxID=2792016 RepID=UPI0018D5FA78|nr:CRISPR-associated protein Csx19 [Streptomyces sp. HB-N217]MBH5135221.1 TIGR03984 family CRISPR-associated protein [Streptomyces sp. HB-N217]
MTTLYGRAHPATTLTDALARADFSDAVALLSAPHAHRVARVQRGHCRTYDDGPGFPEAVFEARVFDGRRELRWLCTAGREGQAVLLGEDPALLPAGFGDALPDLRAADTLPSYYLLWGTPQPATESAGPWTALRTPRIGTLHVPAPTPPKGCRLRLVAREYVCVEPRHGNAHVAEERLLRIEPTELTASTEPGIGTSGGAKTAETGNRTGVGVGVGVGRENDG